MDEDLFEFAEEQRLRIGWHVRELLSAMLAWSIVMVFRIDLRRGCQVPQEGVLPSCGT